MAITLVQSKTGTSGNGTVSATLSPASTAGNLLVAVISSEAYNGLSSYTPPTGWTAVTGDPLGNSMYDYLTSGVYYYANCPGGITSVSFTGATNVPYGFDLLVMEFSGVDTTSPLDASSLFATTAYTATPSTSVTTATSGCLVIGAVCPDAGQNGATTRTTPTGWTGIAKAGPDVNGATFVAGDYQIQAAAGSITYQPTVDKSCSNNVIVVAFKPAGSSGGTTQTGVLPASAGMSSAFLAKLTASGAAGPSGSLSSGFTAQYVGQAGSALGGHGDSGLAAQRLAQLAAALSGSLAANLSTGGTTLVASGAFSGGAGALLQPLALFGATVSGSAGGASTLQPLRTALAAAGFSGSLTASQPGRLVANAGASPSASLAAALVFGNIVLVSLAPAAGMAAALAPQRTALSGASPSGSLAANISASILAQAAAGLAGNLSAALKGKGVYITSAQALGLADALLTGLAFNPTALPPSAIAVALLDGETVKLVGFLTELSSTAQLLGGLTATAVIKD